MEHLGRRRVGGRPGRHLVSGGAGTAVAPAIDDVPPGDDVVVHRRATVPAELSADVWRI
ncbi:hypothetical protein HGI15_00950 [Modestobacter lapidis]|nr:hypothetical protein [Modestobacter lapidis]